MPLNISDVEAIITLTPLTTRSDPHDFIRVLKINPSDTTVVVGRASKNVDKGLVAARENAWFDSPIMSRKHAVFSINSEAKAAFIQDFKSTHGTFVSGRKLLQYENCRLKDWDVITFGVKITAGTETYPPRAFTVNVSWRSWSEPSLTFHPWTPGTFQVPDDDHDSLSDISRADSSVVLASHRRTYSVPSTDSEWDDDDCVALERGPTQDSLNPTPHLPASSVGASQANPIDIDQGQQQSINLDSDDDGPEILPIDATPPAPTAHEKSPRFSQPSALTPDPEPSAAPRSLSRDFGFHDTWLLQQRYNQDLDDNGFFSDPDNVHEAPVRPRLPSPSDAALAKKSSSALTSDEVTHEQIATERPAGLASNDALPGPNLSSRSYDVGPFSYAKKAPHPLTLERGLDGYYGNYATENYDPFRPHQYPQFQSYTSVHALIPKDHWEQPHNSDIGCQDPAGDRHAEPNPTRVNIADLVNQSTSAPQEHNSQGQKRKAAEMEDTTETNDEHTMAGALPAPESKDLTLLPDAQPRDQSTLPLQSVTQESAALQDTHPAESSIQQTIPAFIDIDNNGPARKKVKTRSSKATTGMGKFLSGIAVGVAGVVAAFIATIPASVREEALREINNTK